MYFLRSVSICRRRLLWKLSDFMHACIPSDVMWMKEDESRILNFGHLKHKLHLSELTCAEEVEMHQWDQSGVSITQCSLFYNTTFSPWTGLVTDKYCHFASLLLLLLLLLRNKCLRKSWWPVEGALGFILYLWIKSFCISKYSMFAILHTVKSWIIGKQAKKPHTHTVLNIFQLLTFH